MNERIHLEQDIRRRASDNKFEVWQKMPVRWPVQPLSGDEPFTVDTLEWLPVASFSKYDEAIRFCNRSFLSSNATAPVWAGDGTGSTLSRARTEDLNSESENTI